MKGRRLGIGSWWAIGFILPNTSLDHVHLLKIRVYQAGFVVDEDSW